MGTKIYNSNLTRELQDVVKIQSATDPTPSEIADKVIPVIDVNPKHSRITTFCQGITASNATATTVFTTPTDRDFYLTGVQLSLSKDISAVAVIYYVQITTENGIVDTPLMYFNAQTLSILNNAVISRDFYFPIKLKRGSNIKLTANSATGNFRMDGSIQGFYVDNINA